MAWFVYWEANLVCEVESIQKVIEKYGVTIQWVIRVYIEVTYHDHVCFLHASFSKQVY